MLKMIDIADSAHLTNIFCHHSYDKIKTYTGNKKIWKNGTVPLNGVDFLKLSPFTPVVVPVQEKVI